MKYISNFFIAFFILSCLFAWPVNAQFFSSGNEPFGVKWRTIETDKIKVIFPSDLDSEAARFAGMVELYYPYLYNTMSPKSAKISVIFHNQNLLSNGFVTWAPKRMEIFTTPSREFYAEDWMLSMALHEYRHVLQVDRLNTGLSKFFTFLTGQVGIGLPVAQIPLWFNEGDAVIAESIFGSGRGNLSSFEMPFKAFILESDKPVSYDNSYFGSLKRFVPDYYKLGYFMVGYSRLKHDKNIWNQTINRVGKFPIVPFALNSALKKGYNTNIFKIYHETIDTLKMVWNRQSDTLKLTQYLKIPVTTSDNYTSYRFPHPTTDGFIALKSSINDLDKIVRLDKNGKEFVLHTPGYIFEGRLSTGNRLLVWDEIVSDIRWEQRNYSVIKSLDLFSGGIKTLTKKSRYFSPCILPNEDKIATVEIDLMNHCSLVILNAETGKIINRLPAPEQGLINFPCWVNSSKIITIFTTLYHGKLIYMYDLTLEKWTKITEPTFENISQLAVWGEYILFSAGYSGIDNIYALHIGDKSLFQVTSSRYGAFDPFVHLKSDTVYYSEYTNNGYIPVKMKLIPAGWMPFSNIQHTGTNWAEQLAAQESGGFQIPIVKDTVYMSRPYSRLKNLINIHSWAPFYIDPQLNNATDAQIKPGIIVLSQNKLSTAISSFGISYEDNSLVFRPTFTYSGLFPVFDFSAKIGGTNRRHLLPEGVIPRDSIYPYINYYLRSYIPFRFYNNKFSKFLMPEIDVEYENTLFYHNELQKGIFFVHYRLLFYRYLILNKQDIYPRWGQLLNLTFTNTPIEKSQYGALMSSSATLYMPGLFRHHSLGFRGGIQYQNTKNKQYLYSFNRISLPRGYSSVMNGFVAETMTKFSVDYNFPVAYPDFSIGSLIYIKRMRANFFSDYSYGYRVREYNDSGISIKTGNYNSVGLDFISDLHLFRFYFPFSLGIRISYLPTYNVVHPEMIFSIDTGVF